MKLDHDRLLMSLAKTEAEDNAEHTLSNSKVDQMLLLPEQDQLPAKVANVSRDELRKFVQCKRVGNYLLGKTVGEGSFAKVKEALHILTGEKVRQFTVTVAHCGGKDIFSSSNDMSKQGPVAAFSLASLSLLMW